MIQEILFSYVYVPLRAVDTPKPLAVLGTFVASGMIHVWPLFAAGIGVRASLMMMSYFLSQCALSLTEEVIGVRHWSSYAARRTWTFLATSLPLPLVVAPTLTLVGSAL